jgi:hypothetical protein
MKVFCKKTYFGFIEGKLYEVIRISSVFEPNDFITINDNEDIPFSDYRFRLNKSTEYVEGYIGENEIYFHDYFINIKEERKLKLENILKVTGV